MTQPTVDSIRASMRAAVAAQGAVADAARAVADDLHATRAATAQAVAAQPEPTPPAV